MKPLRIVRYTNRGVHFGYGDGPLHKGPMIELFDKIREGYDIESFRDTAEKTTLEILLLGIICDWEKKSPFEKDVALLNKVIRSGGMLEYIRELENK